MKLEFVPLDKLSVSKTNMRHRGKDPDVSDILPTVRKRGVIQPLIVRPARGPDAFEIVAGRRRFRAATLVAEEKGEAEPLPCAILEPGDDAAAIEISMIENMARLDADEVTQWESFTRLVKEGGKVEGIAATFGFPELMVRRILALGNLVPRIRDLYRAEKLDAATIRHLTMASKSQQKAWLAMYDDPDAYVPTGHQLKAWLFGGQSIKAANALFDVEKSGAATVADLFGDDRYFADPDAFWTAQNAAIEARRAAYLEAGWSDVVVVPPTVHFQIWEHEKAAKRKGGRVYIDVRASGEAVFHEGYVSRKEAQGARRGELPDTARPARPEITARMQTYIDLHRHAAVRAALLGHAGVALRLMVAHTIAGSHLFHVHPEPQHAHTDDIRESVETCRAETVFDEKRRAVLGILGFDSESPTVIGGNFAGVGSAGDRLSAVFLRLLDLPDPAIMEVVSVVIGEALASGSAAVEAVGTHLGVAIADWWTADTAFLGLIRDREVLTAIVAETAGAAIATANAGEKSKGLKAIISDCLAGTNGRTRVERWVPRWMAFPPAAYTARGGVATVRRAAQVEPAAVPEQELDPAAPPAPAPEVENQLAA
jgi:ParB family transcriptional regulator, chromosome partitioning protein